MDKIIEEYKDLNRNPNELGITIVLKDNNNIHPNYSEWKCSLLCPNNSHYKGGLFFLCRISRRISGFRS